MQYGITGTTEQVGTDGKTLVEILLLHQHQCRGALIE